MRASDSKKKRKKIEVLCDSSMIIMNENYPYNHTNWTKAPTFGTNFVRQPITFPHLNLEFCIQILLENKLHIQIIDHKLVSLSVWGFEIMK